MKANSNVTGRCMEYMVSGSMTARIFSFTMASVGQQLVLHIIHSFLDVIGSGGISFQTFLQDFGVFGKHTNPAVTCGGLSHCNFMYSLISSVWREWVSPSCAMSAKIKRSTEAAGRAGWTSDALSTLAAKNEKALFYSVNTWQA